MMFVILVATITLIIGFGFFVTSLFNLPWTLDSLILSIGVMINSIMWLVVAESIELLKQKGENK